MTLKKIALVLTVVIAVIFCLVSVQPANVAEFRESANLRIGASAKIPFNHSFALKGLALSGTWEGSGRAQVWLVGGDKKYLVLDTNHIPEVIEFASFGTPFEAACIQSCSIPPLNAEYLLVMLSSPGFLTINSYHMAVPLEPTGLSACPDCQKIYQASTPSHFPLLLVLLLVISVFGSHVFGHYCESPNRKKVSLMVFFSSFLVLGGLFGLSVVAPTGSAVMLVKNTASIVSALCIIALFVLAAAEYIGFKQQSPPKPDVWKDLEEAEEKWEK